MQTSLRPADLVDYVARQANHFFPDNAPLVAAQLRPAVEQALQCLESCFVRMKLKSYNAGGARFNHLHSDQYLMFLWFVSRELWRNGHAGAAAKLYLLNKALHAFDCMYDTQLPDNFVVFHGVGTVLGKARYSEYLVVFQGCTVGANRDKYPVLGRGLGMGAGASIVGDCRVGDDVSVGMGTTIIDTDISDGMVAHFSRQGGLVLRPARASLASEYFLEEFLRA